MIKYALKTIKDDKFLTFYYESNDNGEFCSDVSFSLDTCSDIVWMVDSYEKAEYVRTHKTEWYNSDYETPKHRYKPGDLKVVKLEINEI